MDISNLRTTVDPGVPTVSGAAPVGGVGSSASGASGPASGSSGAAAPPGSGSTQAQGGASSQQAAAQVSAESLHKAVQKINQQIEQSSGVTLSAGLDTTGEHPGQVLVELSDKSTRQTFFKYYVPAQQVVQASQNLGGGGSAGALIDAKA